MYPNRLLCPKSMSLEHGTGRMDSQQPPAAAAPPAAHIALPAPRNAPSVPTATGSPAHCGTAPPSSRRQTLCGRFPGRAGSGMCPSRYPAGGGVTSQLSPSRRSVPGRGSHRSPPGHGAEQPRRAARVPPPRPGGRDGRRGAVTLPASVPLRQRSPRGGRAAQRSRQRGGESCGPGRGSPARWQPPQRGRPSSTSRSPGQRGATAASAGQKGCERDEIRMRGGGVRPLAAPQPAFSRHGCGHADLSPGVSDSSVPSEAAPSPPTRCFVAPQPYPRPIPQTISKQT